MINYKERIANIKAEEINDYGIDLIDIQYHEGYPCLTFNLTLNYKFNGKILTYENQMKVNLSVKEALKQIPLPDL